MFKLFDVSKVNEKWIIKSGTDFKNLSLVEVVQKHEEKRFVVNKIENYSIDSKLEEDEEMKSIVTKFLSKKTLLLIYNSLN